MIFLKVHKTYRCVVGICDSELIGKNFEEGNAALDIREGFYKGEEISTEEDLEKKIRDLAMEDSTFNIAGEKSIAVALKVGLIKEEGIRKVEGIPFALVLL